MAVRTIGRGTVVLCSDSYPFGNESLRHEPPAGFLHWAIGPGGRVVFDETHLGMRAGVSIGRLARRYRLHGLGLGLLVLAALWVWRTVCPLVPPAAASPGSPPDSIAGGRDSNAGLLALLRRHVPPADLPEVCLAEWRRGFPEQARRLGERLDQVATVVLQERHRPSREQEAARAYRELQACLTQPPTAGHRFAGKAIQAGSDSGL